MGKCFTSRFRIPFFLLTDMTAFDSILPIPEPKLLRLGTSELVKKRNLKIGIILIKKKTLKKMGKSVSGSIIFFKIMKVAM